MNVVAIGEVLWDVFSDKEHLGGAALNFCANVARLGDSAKLLTAVGGDKSGQHAVRLIKELGLDTKFVQRVSDTPTGTAVVSHDAEGHPSFSIRRPAAYDRISLTDAMLADLSSEKPDWLYFGTLFNTEERNESLTRTILEALPTARGFYDMNLRPQQWNGELVRRLCSLASIIKLNEQEAGIFSEFENEPAIAKDYERFCKYLSEQFGVAAVCITLGSEGCFVYSNHHGHHVPGYSVRVSDTVGAGDAFSAAFLHGYNRGLPIVKVAQFANAVGAFVASKAGALHQWTRDEILALQEVPK